MFKLLEQKRAIILTTLKYNFELLTDPEMKCSSYSCAHFADIFLCYERN